MNSRFPVLTDVPDFNQHSNIKISFSSHRNDEGDVYCNMLFYRYFNHEGHSLQYNPIIGKNWIIFTDKMIQFELKLLPSPTGHAIHLEIRNNAGDIVHNIHTPMYISYEFTFSPYLLDNCKLTKAHEVIYG